MSQSSRRSRITFRRKATGEPGETPDAWRTPHNIRALSRPLAFAVGFVLVSAVAFHLVAAYEGQQHSWLTGVYWTISTMTTLGLGDIVFFSDVGRMFTVVVLITGILLFFIVLPFAFIQFFYAPWLEKRRIPERITGHVIITDYANLAPSLIEKLNFHHIPAYVIESDPGRAAAMRSDGVPVFTGSPDDRATYDRMRVGAARLVVANGPDTINTNVTLTVREVAPKVPVAAIVESEASIDILQLAGANHVLPLKQQLGERLASRLNEGHAGAHVIGGLGGLVVAEFAVHNTPFVNRAIGDIRFREELGVNVVGVMERARFVPAGPNTVLTKNSVPVVIGSRSHITELDEFLAIYASNDNPVLVIGGGNVGVAAARRLREHGVAVNLLEKDPAAESRLHGVADGLFIGDAAEREVLMAAGLEHAPGVILTTNDDAMNIYLTVYCRRLVPEIRIVSRITHGRNVEAICRAGADLVLDHTSLGVEAIFAALHDLELLILAEGVEVHQVATPVSLVGRALAETGIGARTGINVIAIRPASGRAVGTTGTTILEAGSRLMLVGDRDQLEAFRKTYR